MDRIYQVVATNDNALQPGDFINMREVLHWLEDDRIEYQYLHAVATDPIIEAEADEKYQG